MAPFSVLVTPQAMFQRRAEVEDFFGDGYVIEFSGAPINDQAKLKERLADKDAAVLGVEKIDSGILAAAPNIKILSRFGTGYDSIDTTAAKTRGVRVAATPARLAHQAVARHAIALTLALAHNIKSSSTAMTQGRWERQANLSLAGKTFGVLGLGGSGVATAMLAQRLGMRIAYWNRGPKPEGERQGWSVYATPEALFEASDIVSIHMAGGSDVENFLNADRLALLKGKFLINTARGSLIDEAALFSLLEAGVIRGAGLDVFKNEPIKDLSARLAALPNVIATPHVASFDAESVLATARAAVANVRAVLEGRLDQAENLVA